MRVQVKEKLLDTGFLKKFTLVSSTFHPIKSMISTRDRTVRIREMSAMNGRGVDRK